MLAVEDLMTRDVVTIEEGDNLALGDDLLKLHHIRHLPVVREGKLVGLVTHRDLIRALARHASSPATPIWAQDVMSRSVETVSPRTSVREVVEKLLDRKFGCVPVVEDDGRLVGIVTDSDLVRLAGQLLEEREQGGRREASDAPTAPH